MTSTCSRASRSLGSAVGSHHEPFVLPLEINAADSNRRICAHNADKEGAGSWFRAYLDARCFDAHGAVRVANVAPARVLTVTEKIVAPEREVVPTEDCRGFCRAETLIVGVVRIAEHSGVVTEYEQSSPERRRDGFGQRHGADGVCPITSPHRRVKGKNSAGPEMSAPTT